MPLVTEPAVRRTGIDIIGDVPWGTHICQFHENRQELGEILVPYFQAGLEENELCIWVTPESLEPAEARAVLAAVPHVDEALSRRQLLILNRQGGELAEILRQSEVRGFQGLRLAAENCCDDAAHALKAGHNMLAICTCPVEKSAAADIMDAVSRHAFSLAKRRGEWYATAGAARRDTEDAFRHQGEWLKVTLSSIGDAVLATDAQARITFLNPVACRLTGWSEQQALGRPAREVLRIVDERTRQSSDDIVDRVLREGQVISLDNHSSLISRNGVEIPIEDSAAPIRDRAGRITGAVLVFHDVTEKRRAEHLLRESESSVRRKLDTILTPEGDVGSLELGDILDAAAIQAAMDDLYGITRIPMAVIDANGKVLVGVGWQDICTRFHRVHPETCAHCIESDTQLAAGAAPGEFKLYKCKNHMWDVATPIMVAGRHLGNVFTGQFFFDDEPLDYELFRQQARRYGFDEREYLAALDAVPRLSRQAIDAGMSFFTKLGHLISLLSYSNIRLARSVFEREELMTSLRESEARLKRSQEIAQLGSWELDVNHGRLSWSDEVYRLFGLPPTEFGATYDAFLQAVHPDDRAAVDAAYRGSLADGADAYEITHRVVRQGGEVRWVHEKCRHLRDDAGKIVRSLGMVQDITERRAAEERIRQQNAILAGINRIFSEALTCETEESLGRACLTVAEQVTQSRFGFIGETDTAGRLMQLAISDPGWDACGMAEPVPHASRSFPIRGLYGRVLRESQGFYSNDPANHPDRAGAPAGHPLLTAFLGVPLIHDGATIGLIAVANREGGYRAEDLDALKTLSLAVVQVLMRWRAKQALREIEERFRLFVDRLPDHAIFMLDAGGLVTTWNEGAQRIKGWSADEILGQHFSTFYPADQVAAGGPWRELEDAAASGCYQTEGERLRKNGSRFWADVTITPLREPGGGLRGFAKVVRDISERKRAEQAVRSAALFPEEDPSPVLRVSRGGVLLFANRSARTLLAEWQAGVGRPVPEFVAQSVARVLAERAPAELNLESGGRDISFLVTPIADQEYANLYGHDVTERKRAEQAMREAQKLESIGVLAGGVAHDFNNLLTSIMGNANLMQLEGAQEMNERLNVIVDSCRKAASLTRQLLAYAGKGQFHSSDFDVARLIRSSAGLIRVSIPRNIELVLDVPRELPLVHGDSSQIQQVVMNLIINAAEAIPEGKSGEVALRAKAVELETAAAAAVNSGLAAGRWIALSVRDTGCGMDDATMARIFDPFFTTKFTGRGLGLAAVQGILRSHQGAITVESQPGSGSTFTVYLPCGAVQAAIPAGKEEAAASRPAMTVLVVDDEEPVRQFVESALRRLGHRSLLAANGHEALELLRTNHAIGLVLLDIVMPKVGGAEAFAEIRSTWPELPVLVSSGYSREEAHRLGLPEDVPFLSKPYTMQTLARAIQSTMESHRSE